MAGQDVLDPGNASKSPAAADHRPTIVSQRPRPLRQLVRESLWLLDLLVSPLVFCAAIIMKLVRRSNIKWLPFSKWIFDKVGVFPLHNHYYDPYIDAASLAHTLSAPRNLPGIDFNDDLQLSILDKFHYNDELLQIPILPPQGDRAYYYANSMFSPPDSEYLYNFIRWSKPRRIVEIGSGMSTLMALNALGKNREEDPEYTCEHICIEPYEVPWLESTGVTVLRQRIEDVDPSLVESLDANDLLFIDSSHIIRHHGDVVTEYLELLPRLRPGVFVHIHDIFSPFNYPEEWVLNQRLFWNEQFLLEAFLTFNAQFKVVGALHYLSRKYRAELMAKCPNMDASCLATSFYMVRCR